VIVPTEWREENVVIGPAPARSQKRWGVRRSVGGSQPARRRRARALTGGTEERSRSEGTTVSDRGRGRRPRRRAGTGTETETG